MLRINLIQSPVMIPANNSFFGRLDEEPQEWTSDETVVLKRAPITVPLDLREWFDTSTLLSWVADEVEVREQAQAFVHQNPGASDSRRRLLALVFTYALCIQKFELSQILIACREEDPFKELCQGQEPFPDELDHFRRVNRSLLQEALGNVLLRALSVKFEIPIPQLPAAVHRDVRSRAEERLDIARHLSTWDE